MGDIKDILFLGLGLLILIIVHIAIGSVNALVNKEWNWKTFWSGVIKGAIFTVSFVAVWFVGWLNKELAIIELNGQTVNLETGVYFILLTGFTYYAGKVLIQLKNVMMKKTTDPNQTDEETINELAEVLLEAMKQKELSDSTKAVEEKSSQDVEQTSAKTTE